MDGSAINPPSSEFGDTSTTSANTTGISGYLKTIQQLLKSAPSGFTSGVHPVKPEDLVLYYDVEGPKARSLSRIDFGNASEEDLAALGAACQQAEGSPHVSPHRVGELNPSKFSARIDVVAAGLVNVIAPELLRGQPGKSLKVERQNLYAYPPGSFVNAYDKIVPRNDEIVGSLVVILPIMHQGGERTFEAGEQTWKFESTSAIDRAAISYFAVHNDTIHSVAPIHTGHCISITYDLVFAEHAGTQVERTLIHNLQALLADPAFLPTGGCLGSGLAHQYVIPSEHAWARDEWSQPILQPSTQWAAVLPHLKGADAEFRFAAERVGLTPRIQLLYDTAQGQDYDGALMARISGNREMLDYSGKDVLLDDIVDLFGVHEGLGEYGGFGGGDECDRSEDVIVRMGTVLQRGDERVEALRERNRSLTAVHADDYRNPYKPKAYGDGEPVHWLAPMTYGNRVRTPYLSSDGMIEHAYGDAGLFVWVPAIGEGVRASVV
ncbi:hypothetical protein K438DRAFT_1992335 [Mycena galopus ATCC 62051]|nr:hypothetical protein K438DRAFT_1992335 [Mycena galopus ATCC 62051]